MQAPPLEVTIQLFWDKVDRRGPDECWEWQASCRAGGHGQFTAKGIKPFPMGAHAFSYWLANGHWAMPACLHHCDNAPCVNPAHLYEGDQAQNMRDRVERNPRWGSKNPAAKHGSLVQEIRTRVSLHGESQADVCRSLGLNSAVVSRIVRGINFPNG